MKRQLCLLESENKRLRHLESSGISAAVTLDYACIYFVLAALLHNECVCCSAP